MWWSDGMMGAGFGVMALLWLLVIGGIVALVFALVQLGARGRGNDQGASGSDSRPRGGPSTSAREILEQRLARGEIDTDEFTERLRALDGR